MWRVAYLESMLPDGACDGILGDKIAMDEEIARVNAFMTRRYPLARVFPRAGFEIMSIIDRLMIDMGLREQRKKARLSNGLFGSKGWLREYFEPYMSSDYRGIVGEFLKTALVASKK